MIRKSTKPDNSLSLSDQEPQRHFFDLNEEMRLDKFLAHLDKEELYSRSFIAGLIEKGAILVNGGGCLKSHKLKPGDEITVWFPEIPEPTVEPEDLPITVLYEDDSLAVVDKPAGMTVHPAPGHRRGTFVNALAHRFGKKLSTGSDPLRPGIVHRLDKDTSGLIVVAKDDRTHSLLSRMFHDRKVEKTYIAIVLGVPEPIPNPSGFATIDLSIGRHPRERQKMAVVEGGRRAITHYRVVDNFGFASRLEVRIETGRTHQIRVHLTHIGYPVLGDRTYSTLARELNLCPHRTRAKWESECRHHLLRQALHAHRLRFVHPISGITVDVTDPLPTDLDQTLHLLYRIQEEAENG